MFTSTRARALDDAVARQSSVSIYKHVCSQRVCHFDTNHFSIVYSTNKQVPSYHALSAKAASQEGTGGKLDVDCLARMFLSNC